MHIHRSLKLHCSWTNNGHSCHTHHRHRYTGSLYRNENSNGRSTIRIFDVVCTECSVNHMMGLGRCALSSVHSEEVRHKHTCYSRPIRWHSWVITYPSLKIHNGNKSCRFHLLTLNTFCKISLLFANTSGNLRPLGQHRALILSISTSSERLRICFKSI